MSQYRAVLALTSILAPVSAQAEIQDYQIRRLVLYDSECRIEAMQRQALESGGLRFQVTCENLSFYPDGLQVDCSDKDDETSCAVQTEAKQFDQLRLLQ